MGVLATLTLAAALGPSPSPPVVPPVVASQQALSSVDDARFICTLRAIQNAIRWPRKSGRTASGKHLVEVTAWTPERGAEIGQAFIDAGRRHGLSPVFLSPFAVNESDLRPDAVRESRTADGKIAKDSGLMAVRCILGDEKRWWLGDRVLQRPAPGAKFRRACVNAPVRGMTVEELLVPATNIEIAAGKLEALRRDGVSVWRTTIKKVHGRPKLVREAIACQHKTHPWWGHYNSGTVFKETGPARHYPHRVAVLGHAIIEAMGIPTPPELSGIKFVQDKGQKPRRIDKPVGERQRRLASLIQSCRGRCDEIAAR